MSLAFRCGQCDGEPAWSIFRVGDAVVSWACDPHLAAECASLQRDWDVTELRVRLWSKQIESVEIGQALERVASEFPAVSSTPERKPR
jgi:hypothetical protein